jgi:uncharacterized protein (TIGR00297 family)
MKLKWQSKVVLLLVLPTAVASVVLQIHWWAVNWPPTAAWTAGLSLLLGLLVLQLHAATPAAAFTGAVITAWLIFSTTSFPYHPWQTALMPILAVSLLAYFATRLGRERKERLGTAEKPQGRTAAQVAANLGVAALVSDGLMQAWFSGFRWLSHVPPIMMLAVGVAALAEAAADTVSSEVGQVLGGQPRMITTLRLAEPGTDGAVSLLGTLAGTGAAGIVALVGTLALHGGASMFWISIAGGIFGLFFDSLLGATFERRDWLNNDAVNFCSTASAAAFALLLLSR